MPDKVEKFLCKLDWTHRTAIGEVLARIRAGDFDGLHIRKLEGEKNRYRVRKGNVRIKYSLNAYGKGEDVEIEWRSDTTYR